MSVIAIIPARGGSKSVPRKNVLPLAGKPLVAHAIEAALASKRVERVVVSTDDAEIRTVSLSYGAEVIDRPADLATDTASSESALLHALKYLESTEGYRPETIVFLQCTSPFTLPEDIDGTIERLDSDDADSAFTASPFHGFIWRNHDGDAAGVNHDKRIRRRRQELSPEFLETGAVYAMRADGFRASRHRFFGKTVIYETPVDRALEIDEPSEFAQAAALLVKREQRTRALPANIKALAMDFDGVFTDDGVVVDQDGREAVTCSRSDGMGIELLRTAGLPMVVLSKERVPIVAHRCAKLGIDVHHGIDAKLDLFRQWLSERGINAADVIYIGNDVNDLECMAEAGCAVAPADAHEAALSAADIVLTHGGGKGAVRELADMILRHESFVKADTV